MITWYLADTGTDFDGGGLSGNKMEKLNWCSYEKCRTYDVREVVHHQS